MANTFLTPDIIARAALANLYETTVMAPLVHRDYSPEFMARIGDTVTVRKPAMFEGKEFVQATGIEPQDATEGSVDVTLNHFADVSFTVTTKQLTLELLDFNEQLLNPAMEAIAQKIDNDILALRSDIVDEVGVAGTSGHDWNVPEVLIDAGRVMNRNKVPTRERRAVIGPDTLAPWLDADILKQANTSGSTEALREAWVGRRLFGFDPYWTQNVEAAADTPAAGEPTTEVGIAFHRTAMALVTRPLEIPPGAVNIATASYKGFGLRVAYDYDIKYKQTTVSVDCLYGTKVLDANRAVLLKGADQV